MFRIFATAIVIAFFSTVDVRAQQTSKGGPDPFDLTSVNALAKSSGGIPTAAAVDALGKRAQELYDKGDCLAALPQLDRYARQANYLANLIAAGLDPFYSASYDDKKKVTGTRVLVGFENEANAYKEKRNKAFLMQAECHKKSGDMEKALASYQQALRLLSMSEEDTWAGARRGLYQIIGTDSGNDVVPGDRAYRISDPDMPELKSLRR